MVKWGFTVPILLDFQKCKIFGCGRFPLMIELTIQICCQLQNMNISLRHAIRRSLGLLRNLSHESTNEVSSFTLNYLFLFELGELH